MTHEREEKYVNKNTHTKIQGTKVPFNGQWTFLFRGLTECLVSLWRRKKRKNQVNFVVFFSVLDLNMRFLINFGGNEEKKKGRNFFFI